MAPTGHDGSGAFFDGVVESVQRSGDLRLEQLGNLGLDSFLNHFQASTGDIELVAQLLGAALLQFAENRFHVAVQSGARAGHDLARQLPESRRQTGLKLPRGLVEGRDPATRGLRPEPRDARTPS